MENENLNFEPETIDPGVLQKYLQELPDKALRFGVKILLAVIVLIVGIQIIKLLRRIVRKSMQRANADTGVVQFVDSFLKAVLYILLFFMIASGFGLNTASIVALLGSAGVAIGLAVQGSLSNFAGGVLILLLKPFKVDDYIIISGNANEGTVMEIQLFYTKLVTVDNHVVIIPNGELTTSNIINMSTLSERRINISVSIAYDADIRTAKEVIRSVLEQDAAVLKDKEHFVFVDELADSGVNLKVRCWSRNEDYWETKWRLTENVKYALDEAGISIPFPQMDVHLEQK
ncbi:MAG: mechanosensitive ion channel [Lachnospiraceae bacterium]|nr:mechanosensitive ion channel [Lachnospiraceae bacterium]